MRTRKSASCMREINLGGSEIMEGLKERKAGIFEII